MFMSKFFCLYAWYLERPEEGIIFPGSRIIDHCELLCGCCKLNLGPLKEVLFIA